MKIPAQHFTCQPSPGTHICHLPPAPGRLSPAAASQVPHPAEHISDWPNGIQMNGWWSTLEFVLFFSILTCIFSLPYSMREEIKIKWFGYNPAWQRKKHMAHGCYLTFNPRSVMWSLRINPSDKWPDRHTHAQTRPSTPPYRNIRHHPWQSPGCFKEEFWSSHTLQRDFG